LTTNIYWNIWIGNVQMASSHLSQNIRISSVDMVSNPGTKTARYAWWVWSYEEAAVERPPSTCWKKLPSSGRTSRKSMV
jgi:hypothetical protein